MATGGHETDLGQASHQEHVLGQYASPTSPQGAGRYTKKGPKAHAHLQLHQSTLQPKPAMSEWGARYLGSLNAPWPSRATPDHHLQVFGWLHALKTRRSDANFAHSRQRSTYRLDIGVHRVAKRISTAFSSILNHLKTRNGREARSQGAQSLFSTLSAERPVPIAFHSNREKRRTHHPRGTTQLSRALKRAKALTCGQGARGSAAKVQ